MKRVPLVLFVILNGCGATGPATHPESNGPQPTTAAPEEEEEYCPKVEIVPIPPPAVDPDTSEQDLLERIDRNLRTAISQYLRDPIDPYGRKLHLLIVEDSLLLADMGNNTHTCSTLETVGNYLSGWGCCESNDIVARTETVKRLANYADACPGVGRAVLRYLEICSGP